MDKAERFDFGTPGDYADSVGRFGRTETETLRPRGLGGAIEGGAKAFVEFGGFAEGFRKRGVGMDGAGEIGGGGADFQGQRRLPK